MTYKVWKNGSTYGLKTRNGTIISEDICMHISDLKKKARFAKKLVKVKYISLVNLIMDEEIVIELVQDKLTANNISMELDKILKDKSYRNSMLEKFIQLRNIIGSSGASENTAKYIYKYLSTNK